PTKRFIVSIDRSKIGCFTIVDKGEKREKIPLNIIANASETAFGSNIKQKLLTNYTYCRLQNLVCTKVFDNSLQLHSFIIEDKYRNQKIGKYVLNYIFKEYDINISNILHLFVLKNNPALNFYLKNHFIVHKKIIGALAMLELKYPGYILVSSI
ncbi:GNAT family N-acetyltransferase, partial [Salmonella enterica subsp. enterica]|nr:N-acetyltransferase [Salmonella enterica subsp. enterica]EJI0206646.1 GNAT family N-acetyltransferase [Salmonella enterica subsp. enterica]